MEALGFLALAEVLAIAVVWLIAFSAGRYSGWQSGVRAGYRQGVEDCHKLTVGEATMHGGGPDPNLPWHPPQELPPGVNAWEWDYHPDNPNRIIP